MLGLTPLGVAHTAFSLVAIVAGIWAMARDREIVPASRLGQAYLAATVITAATGLMIFRHGSFGTGHKLAVATLVLVAIGMVAAKSSLFGRGSRYVQAIGFSSTLLMHAITGSAETLTRLPPGAPVLTAANISVFGDIVSGLIALFVLGLACQLRWIQLQLKQRGYTGDIRA